MEHRDRGPGADRVSLAHALLGLLAEEPMSGYDLTKRFDSSLRYTWSASHSQIYPELARLRERGFIRQRAAGPRGRKTYEITPTGREEVRRWLTSPVPERTIREEAFLRVFFLWLLSPDDARAYLERKAAFHRSNLAEYEDIKAGGDPQTPAGRSARIALESGIRHELALAEWAEWAAGQVDGDRRRRAGGRAARARARPRVRRTDPA